MEKHHLVLSVHSLVDFLLRTGDIDNRIYNRSTMQEGSKIHSIFQESQGSDYESEYALKLDIPFNDFIVTLEGRADGITFKDNVYTIDEIKSTVENLREFRNQQLEWHLGQAKCYAYMLAVEKKLKRVSIRLIYIKQGDGQKLIESYNFSKKELEIYIYSLLDKYFDFYKVVERHNLEKNESISNLPFPFENYRTGQRELAKFAYSIGKNGGVMLSEAPTGIGKTMSILYPTLKASINIENAKILYLTAKNSGKESASNAINILKDKGLKAKEITIQAKEKICFSNGKGCNPDECPFTIGYYEKLSRVIKSALIKEKSFTTKVITKIAKRENMCPFELSLDLSLFSDVIICDYNYAFDPLVYLKRYFDADSSNLLFLVDEAHNLVTRSKEMYSAFLSSYTLEKAYESVRKCSHKELLKYLRKLKKYYKNLIEENSPGQYKVIDFSGELYSLLIKLYSTIQDINKNFNKDITKELLELFLEISSFNKISEFVNEDNYLSYFEIKEDKTVVLKHFCLDASRYLRNIFRSVHSSFIFSGTLSPINYYVKVLGADPNKDPYLMLPSPFDRQKLKVMIAPKPSLLYSNRDKTYSLVASYLKEFTSHKVGNYFIYFPSYEYLENILPHLSFPKKSKIYFQKKDMSDEEKEQFIAKFKANPKTNTIGLCVIGGAFAEGIDLVSDRLIGAALVGIGLSKINYESDNIASYYSNNGLNGKDFAYLYPAMNKITQAIGRVIRSEDDKGAVLLIDERYSSGILGNFIKEKYPQYELVLNENDIKDELISFFS